MVTLAIIAFAFGAGCNPITQIVKYRSSRGQSSKPMAVEAAARAPFASDPARSRGRRYDEPPAHGRSVFRRDCDRIIHATAFRRLAHKTQVFVFHEGDHFRTRLTH